MSKKEKKKDILDDVRKVEKKRKALILARSLSHIKELAKKVRKAKAESTILLEEIGIEDADIKRIVDYVNELDDTKLSDSDRRNIRDKARDRIRLSKEKVDKVIVDRGGNVGVGTANPISAVDNVSSVTFTDGNSTNRGLTVDL